MPVEMQQPQRASAARPRPQQRERDRVIAAERHQMFNPRRLLLDLGDRARNVAMCDAEIADIGEVERFDLGLGRWVIVDDSVAARLADCGCSVARSSPDCSVYV